MADVLVTENIVGPAMERLGREWSVAFEPELWRRPERLGERLEGVRALVVRNQTQVTEALLARGAALEIVARAGTGLDNIDVEAASRSGVVVAWTPVQNSVSVAELAIGLMLALARGIPRGDRHVKQGGWARHEFHGLELWGKTLGIVGFGRIGFLTAMRARGFGMEVVAHDPFVDPDSPLVVEARARLVGLEELLARADVISCHLPGGPSTRGLFDYGRFCQAKRGALFVNVARGEVVDEAGLIRALEEGRLGGAALDVRQVEPPAAGPLSSMDNVILTPHIGAFTREAQQRVVAAVCRDVDAVLRGEPAAHYVNFPRPRDRCWPR
ncbi:MAG TPA: hydroxyacid dehydrogenase [Planctomycetaceae bacterium]|nr:hydroxyacid dehydrogenase [Planctomycetaceae bacterium]HIQ20350.1 hydroxyacid dehydrogenase [Planctomycetota bacterium]